jgi:hypothetical protein
MSTNAEYQKASLAIEGFKNGSYSTLESSAATVGADLTLVNVMLSNPGMTEQQYTDETVQKTRFSICSQCEKNTNNICMICACPINFVTSVKSSTCPEGKW